MDTKLTKRYTIIFLLILNIVLFIINILAKDSYVISNEQKNIITNYAKNQNVELNFNISKEYYPMQNINMKKVVFNENDLKEIFFDNKNPIEREESFENVILTQGQKIININNFYVSFQDLKQKEKFIFDKQNALRVASQYKNKIAKKYGRLYLDNIIIYDKYIEISYIQKENRKKIFNNILNIKVCKDGSIELYFNFYKTLNEDYQKIDICSPDEAIYSFIKDIKNILPYDNVIVDSMELGYYLKDYEEDISFIFIPYYRFCLDNGEIFYVNAYTNTFEYNSNFVSKEKIY